jgi:uncharacterized membrane protein YfcA
MTSIDPGLLALLVAFILVGAMVNGLIGMGFSLIAVNIIAVALGTKEAVIVMSLVSPVTAGYQLWLNRSVASLWIRLRPVLAGAFVGSLFGAQLLVIAPTWTISLALGAFTVQFVIDRLRTERPRMESGRERRMGPFVGFVSGTTNGALGASGPVIGSFLLAIGLRGKEFVFAVSLVFFLQGIFRGSLFALNGQYTTALVLASLAILIPALLGQQAGLKLRGRVDAKMFQRILLTVLLISSANLLIRGVEGAYEAARTAGLIG